jgi:hypothetical protein
VKIDFVGFLSREGCFMFDLTTLFLFPMIILISRGVFGRIKIHLMVFFAWSATLEKILTMDNQGNDRPL